MIIDKVIKFNTLNKEEATKKATYSEKSIRSVAKAISWRIIGTLDTMLISYLITGEVKMAVAIGAIEVITKMMLYFFHERIWNLVKWGKQ